MKLKKMCIKDLSECAGTTGANVLKHLNYSLWIANVSFTFNCDLAAVTNEKKAIIQTNQMSTLLLTKWPRIIVKTAMTATNICFVITQFDKQYTGRQ